MQPQVSPVALAQAMAFMATPAGMQTMAAFTNMVGGAGAPHLPQSPPSPLQSFHHQAHQSPPQLGSAKQNKIERAVKWKAEQIPQPTRTVQQPKPKPPRAKAKPSPAVPSFGFSLPAPPTLKRPATSKVDSRGGQKRRKVHLGLTRREEPESESSSGDEELDEEATLASNVANKGLVFEHDGHDISLQTSAEIAAWIKDRKRQYPTSKRIAEKAKEKAEKRASELEFLRKVKGDTGKSRADVQEAPAPTAAPAPTDTKTAEERKATIDKHQAELQKLRKRLHESLAINKAKSDPSKPNAASSLNKPQAVDLGLGYTSETESESDDDNSSELQESSVVSSSDDSDDSGDSDSDSGSPPEEQSAKIPIPVTVVPPPPPIPASTKPKFSYCFSWKQYGRCKHGSRCRYEHPPKEEKKVKKLGLFERLVEQEKEQGDRLALDAIKYLGRHGFLG